MARLLRFSPHAALGKGGCSTESVLAGACDGLGGPREGLLKEIGEEVPPALELLQKSAIWWVLTSAAIPRPLSCLW